MAFAALLVLVACGDDTAFTEQIASLNEDVDELTAAAKAETDRANAAENDVESLNAQIADLKANHTAEIEAVVAERDRFKSAHETALQDAQKARADYDGLRQRFDPEIQSARAAFDAALPEAVCSTAQAAGIRGESYPTLASIVASLAHLLPLDVEATLDESAMRARLDECYVAGKEQGEREAAVALLIQPKGQGIWTVGLEIAAGRWRSTGDGQQCYWQRSPDGAPDDIIDNHFGSAGGTVTLREGEEFQTQDCGTWEFVG